MVLEAKEAAFIRVSQQVATKRRFIIELMKTSVDINFSSVDRMKSITKASQQEPYGVSEKTVEQANGLMLAVSTELANYYELCDERGRLHAELRGSKQP